MELNEFLTALQDFLNMRLFELQETPVTIMSMVIFLVFLIFFLFLGAFVRKVLHGKVLDRFEIDPGLQYTLARVSQYLIVTIGVLISFQFVGIDLTGLAVIFGLLSVGIGFGLQNITANFISGLIVMFERPISVGDRVDVAGIEGDVTEINIRSTKIRTLNNVSIIVPNTEFVSNNVINYSHGEPTFRLDINVGVSYSSDLEIVLKALNEVAEEHPRVMKIPAHQVHLIEFGDSSWDMQLRAWISNVKDRYILRNELHQAIVKKFDELDIEIPFPQRDLHVRSSVALPVDSKKRDEHPQKGAK
ncbi:mechanosensitive ion channel family protein [Rhodohalobacter sp. SW132]|uniref:mechanosensitive ion channel family protein n=1 Tax=Rhodohalobacter sp. SW132 TaxID=2293433 RepID=UPI000E266695|nr:mechanosensitive ion channel domain-containing protein [Rhodohalobacter sp. SW132]REL38779.1 mechanosensitive ion channel family protein [Rhodohalobacter sp. SW132]